MKGKIVVAISILCVYFSIILFAQEIENFDPGGIQKNHLDIEENDDCLIDFEKKIGWNKM